MFNDELFGPVLGGRAVIVLLDSYKPDVIQDVEDSEISSLDMYKNGGSWELVKDNLSFAGLENVELAKAAGLRIAGCKHAKKRNLDQSYFLTKGHLEHLKNLVDELEVDLVVVAENLSSAQQRNLERSLAKRVVDRTYIILEIFARRAKSNHGKLQVELARCKYISSRLIRAWTHLERQKGGIGLRGGPGETQIEIDRRLLRERIARITKLTSKFSKTKSIHRQGRTMPIIAMVGYTNVGKSTLFNKICGARVESRDALFATLETTFRVIEVGEKQRAILVDTVGFITDLPDCLLEAFYATLEEVKSADIILHLHNASVPGIGERADVVKGVLQHLGVDIDKPGKIVDIYNVFDCMEYSSEKHWRSTIDLGSLGEVKNIVSARSGFGFNQVRESLAELIRLGGVKYFISVQPIASDLISWIYENTIVQSADFKNDEIMFQVWVADERVEELINMTGYGTSVEIASMRRVY